MLGVTYKTAWFMSHRIREGMRPAKLTPMGGAGKIVESDETVIGRLEASPDRLPGGWQFRNIVMTLVERGGPARSFHIAGTTMGIMLPIIRTNISRESYLMTDQAKWYTSIGKEFADHGTVNHAAFEFGRGPITSNTVEGYFSIFKRGMRGIYQHCSEKHLHRYLSEFDFRYSNRIALGIGDAARADLALQGITGKRLTYRRPREAIDA
jgi:hypothetical protein